MNPDGTERQKKRADGGFFIGPPSQQAKNQGALAEKEPQ
jgi:hypothetical protein